MPEHPVYFGVSQEYANPDTILPVVPGNTHVENALKSYSTVWDQIEENGLDM